MKLFGTDGIRGIAERDLTAELANNLGLVAGQLLCDTSSSIVIGRDTRGSGQWLEDALSEGFLNQGVKVIKAGVIPTPAISFLTRKLGAQLGIVISASHNPSEYNGIKFFNASGIKLEEEFENQIEEKIAVSSIPSRRSSALAGQINGNELYLEHLKEAVDVSLKGMEVVLDCANGAASVVGPQLFEELGVNVRSHACRPDGVNINLKCGSTHPQHLQQIITQHKCDGGFAFDGDADRAIAVSEKGDVIDGDFIMAICAKELHEEGKLPGNKIVTTVMTNLGFHLAMKESDIEVLVTKVGDKYVLDKMIETNAVLGGEQSGHIIFLEHGPAGDGLLTALELLMVVQKTGKPLSELAQVMERLPQVLINVEVKNKVGWQENTKLTEAIEAAERELGQKGRLLVRPSGTEHLIRVMTESDDFEHANDIANNVAQIVREEFS